MDIKIRHRLFNIHIVEALKEDNQSNKTEQILKTIIQETSSERKLTYVYEEEAQFERREERKKTSVVSRKYRISWDINAIEL